MNPEPNHHIDELGGLTIYVPPGSKPSRIFMQNVKDTIDKLQATEENRAILYVIHALTPAYENEIVNALGTYDRSTLRRKLGELVDEGMITLVGPELETVRYKVEHLGVRRGAGPSKFYVVNQDRTIFDVTTGQYTPLMEFIDGSRIPPELKQKIIDIENYHAGVARERALSNVPKHVKVEKFILNEFLQEDGYQVLPKHDLNSTLKRLWYQCIGKWPTRNDLNFFRDYLFANKIIIRGDNDVPVLINPDLSSNSRFLNRKEAQTNDNLFGTVDSEPNAAILEGNYGQGEGD